MEAWTATATLPRRRAAGQGGRFAPSRANGVKLIGELANSGYVDSPLLARRDDGQVVKLTPLLYEVLKGADGSRDHHELAALVSEKVGKQATAEDVQFLIERKLEPLGLIQTEAGTPATLPRSNPLLALHPRIVVTRADLTQKLSDPFVWLFKPLIAAPLIALFAWLTLWLLFDKGLSSSLHQAFYEPQLILLVWILVVLSAAFHEIGHAAACRFAGVTPGVMGAGLYLVWPAFYTEVSEAYGLPRRDRLRVDLGGLYFSALFGLLSFGVWAVTDLDAVLLVVAVQLLQMVRQLVPFIRADGYHLVADVVGVPDLFAHIKPTLRGLLPGRRHAKHQALKPWARAVVTTWVLVTVPLLAAMLAYLVLIFPELAATGWDSAGIQVADLRSYWAEADVFGVITAAVSIVLVALPVASVVFLVVYMGTRLGKRMWRNTAGRPRHRVAACAAGACLVGAVAWAWWPGEDYHVIQPQGATVPTPTIPSEPPAGGTGSLVPVSEETVLAAAPAARSVAQVMSALPGAAIEVEDMPAPADLPRDPAPAPQAVPPEPSEQWPFPFDPPIDMKLGDNRAMAVATDNGSEVWDFATDLSVVQDEPALHANEAYALASCKRCAAGAVGFQVLLITESAEIAPLNAAVAVTYECRRCATLAVAYQIVATLPEDLSPAMLLEIEQVLARVDRLERSADELPAVELLAALDAAQAELLAIIGVDADAVSEIEEEGDVDAPVPPLAGQPEGTGDPELPEANAEPASGTGGDPPSVEAPEQAVPETPEQADTADTEIADTPSESESGEEGVDDSMAEDRCREDRSAPDGEAPAEEGSTPAEDECPEADETSEPAAVANGEPDG